MIKKYHSQFLLDKEKNRNDARLRYRIKWDDNIVAFNLGYRIEVEKWSVETQRCKANTTHGKKKIPASIINSKIQLFEKAFLDTKIFFEAKKETPTKEQFQTFFNVQIGREKKIVLEKDFFEYYDDFLIEEGTLKQLTQSVKGRLKQIKNSLLAFDNNLSFDNFSEEKFVEYIYFLQKKNVQNTSILKYIPYVKRFLRWAVKKGYYKNTFFEKFNPKLKTAQKKVIFLTPSEFKKFREFEIPEDKKYFEQVRDIFLFQCFTGLRYSEVKNLKKSDIKKSFIEITTFKTIDSLKIELNEYSLSILKKYENYVSEKNLALPVLNIKTMNDLLKELGELVGIDEPIGVTYFIGNKRYDEVYPKYALLGTHAGRRTFVCNALSLGIPPQIVMKWTGHNDYKSMKPYIDIADEVKKTAMEKFNTL